MSAVNTIKVQEEDVQALIFDCDGTLIDTMPAFWEAWVQTCQIYDLDFNEKRFYSMAGIPVRDIFEILISEAKHLKVKPDIDTIVKTKLEVSAITVAEIGTPKIDAVVAIAHKYHGKVPLAVASSGNRSNVMQALRDNGILDMFDAVVTAEDVVNHKPAPDIFLLAAHKLGCDPTKCRGYEDANAGLIALQAAGMEAIDVRLLAGYPHVEASSKSVLEMEYRGASAKFAKKNTAAKKEEETSEVGTFLRQLVIGGVVAYLLYILLAHLVYEAVKEDAWSAD
uniref:Phosphatase n=1 Tax=Spumella elongata TaxID=89044 RepID=A0A7S3GXE4_9STRA|mmetsp:Transcript_24121/g.41538  ORF Transcript_24121/g.41538 Transcript_24121/m.41538 type:complete len:281 (+) Transcript_24121:39-881(+)|eukprot:CAMPEP_0184976570 /NCGR_PEP_ID=MMETSP1098-20130426/7502_1 /TAXON_ID=89044 /ORGANISM="Spumella elongata, Strain CCAP 955/1" /LENGTH=280 /DNA_ID=CAMNT_0027499471 /DNA_START=35 /DNA_END=877 /DNA_ORIENTATION=-